MGSKAGNILKTVAPIALSLAFPGIGTAIGGALGATGAFAPALGGALLGAGGGLLGGGGLKGALLGGATGGLGGYATGGGFGDILGGGSGGGGGGISSLFGSGSSGSVAGAGAGTLNGLDEAGMQGLSGFDAATGGAGLSGGAAAIGGGGASSFGGSGGGSSFGSSLGPGGLANALSGVGNYAAENKAEDQLVKSQQNSLAALKPFLANGTSASNTLNADLPSLTTPFTPGDLQNEPGYQFDLGQGNKALNNSLAASGMLGSGSAIKAGQQFAQGLADTTYGNAFNRDLATKQNTYNTLSGAAAPGLTAGVGTADINNNIGTAQSKGTQQQANTITSTLASLLSGSGARQIVGYDANGHAIYAS